MNSFRSLLLHLCVFVIVPSLAAGQNDLHLPELLPSYSEDFSEYSSYPSMSFDNAFLDDNGKLWLKTTESISATSALHLFQFDGYRFKLVRGELARLKSTDNIAGIYQQRKLVGWSKRPDNNQLFFYDLNTDRIEINPLPIEGTIENLTVSGDDRIFLTVVDVDRVTLYEWKAGKLEEQGRFKEPVLAHSVGFITETLHHDGTVFWAAIRDAGYIIRFDKKNGKSKKYYFSDFQFQKNGNHPVNTNNPPLIFALFHQGQLYVSNQMLTGSTIFRWNPVADRFETLENIPGGWTGENIFRDEAGNLLFLFKDNDRQFRAILQDIHGKRFEYSAFFKNLAEAGVNKVVSQDFKREIIICNSKGIKVHTVKASEAIRNFLPSYSIRAMAELPDEKYLIKTQFGPEFIVDGRSNSVTPFKNPDCTMGWTKLYKDRNGHIWTNDVDKMIEYDPVSNTCKQHFCQAEIFRLFAFISDRKIALVNRNEALYIHDLAAQKTEPFLVDGKQLIFPGYTHAVIYGLHNLLWVATAQGLWKIDINTHKTEVLGYEPPFDSPSFLCMDQDDRGRLWLGTPLHGLYIYDPVSGEAINLNNEDGLPNNTIANIIADDEGVRWIGTYNGISLVSAEGELITNIYQEDGLIERENNRYATLKTSTGKLLMGTISGVNLIDPKKIKERISGNGNLRLYLTSLSFFDRKTGQDTSMEYGLQDIHQVELPASRRFLNLGFALSNYFKPEQNQYAYMLEGVDNDWTPLGNQHSLSLNNLPAGKYNLLIKGSDGLGNWTQPPLSIAIYARGFFYTQIWFYLLLILFLIGVAVLWIRRLRVEVKQATKKIRRDKETIEKQAEKLLELDEAKSRFFTNISHEFRTPLTIISGMIDQIREKPDSWLERGHKMIKQNTEGLLNLVNQILDLRKLESKELKVNLVQGDVVKYLRFISESHQSYANSKGLRLHFLAAEPEINMDYDPEKLLRIISNLLSNAIKFTPEGGNVYFHIDRKNKDRQPALSIRVEDTGSGIPEDQLPHIFNRFYQVDDSSTRYGEGTGIGLALTIELVRLLDGKIEVKSQVGKGTTFYLNLPISEKAQIRDGHDPDFREGRSNMENAIVEPALVNPHMDLHSGVTQDVASDGYEKPTLLIVEDNPDVQQYLIACLEGTYQIILADNGRVGIETATEQVPDLIVSDVMMPEKDGFELTDTLKKDERTDHIPIVLLTARADTDSRISGLEKGADAYLAKPFEKRELLIRLEKLLALRQTLQARYARFSPEENGAAGFEDPFLQKFYALVEKELANPDLDMVRLCRSLGMSRSQVFRKLKALTGKSASLFIRSIRLQKGRQLLADSDLTVSEVAYEVGFTSLNYFSAAVFEEFGIRPSATRK
ncbi:MAG TPA: ATP-binding protein [Flavilitoribacter sp.]|nr:ATP-binding protein [Flavilitoribacter sp.]